MTENIEKILADMLDGKSGKMTASELYILGYEPHHRTMRKRMEICDNDYYIVFRHAGNGLFEFAAIFKDGEER